MSHSDASNRPSRDKAIHHLFEEQAAANPDAVAVLFENQELSYAELNRRANRLARELIGVGVDRGTPVGLCMNRSPELIVALLATLKTGGAYVPLDPHYPGERLAFMLQDTGAPVTLVQSPTRSQVQSKVERAGSRCIAVDNAAVTSRDDDNPANQATAQDLAYVIYTSGSTGQPKGVLVEHRAVLSRVREVNYCHLGSEEVFLHFAPLSFDASTFEIWGPLLNGGRLALLPPGPPALDMLGGAIQRYGVTTLFLTTALFNLAVEQHVKELRQLRQLLMGGELVSPRHVQKAVAELLDGRLLHVYGPTECTTFACCFPVSKHHRCEDGVPIGRPISNTAAYVLDDRLQQVAAGTPGELYLGGDGLARGYLNNPKLTQAKFVRDPFTSDPAARLYRTGDRVCVQPDGNLEFLGRFDNQVKIRGHRIEPGEIEATLQQHPEVCQTVVIARTLPRGEKQLVAYVVVNPARVSADTLKDYLVTRLPCHLVPAHFVLIDRLPLNHNGKVDHAALPAPERHRPSEAVAGIPVTEIERKLMALWSRILNSNAGLDENFFDLGGTSLQLLEVHAELTRMFGQQLAMTELFEHATVRSLAGCLTGKSRPDSSMMQVQDRAKRQKTAFARQKPVKGPGA